jgi:hypothetical protein
MNLTAQKSSEKNVCLQSFRAPCKNRSVAHGSEIQSYRNVRNLRLLNNRMQARLEVHARRRVHLLRRAQRLVRVGAALQHMCPSSSPGRLALPACCAGSTPPPPHSSSPRRRRRQRQPRTKHSSTTSRTAPTSRSVITVSLPMPTCRASRVWVRRRARLGSYMYAAASRAFSKCEGFAYMEEEGDRLVSRDLCSSKLSQCVC